MLNMLFCLHAIEARRRRNFFEILTRAMKIFTAKNVQNYLRNQTNLWILKGILDFFKPTSLIFFQIFRPRFAAIAKFEKNLSQPA